jgi:hypothetical protein
VLLLAGIRLVVYCVAVTAAAELMCVLRALGGAANPVAMLGSNTFGGAHARSIFQTRHHLRKA